MIFPEMEVTWSDLHLLMFSLLLFGFLLFVGFWWGYFFLCWVLVFVFLLRSASFFKMNLFPVIKDLSDHCYFSEMISRILTITSARP